MSRRLRSGYQPERGGAASKPPQAGSGLVPKQMPDTLRGFIARLTRRVLSGFDGEITLRVKSGGVAWARWTETDEGEDLRGELSASE